MRAWPGSQNPYWSLGLRTESHVRHRSGTKRQRGGVRGS